MSLAVAKTCQPRDLGGVFQIGVSNGASESASLACGQSAGFNLEPGVYTLSETAPRRASPRRTRAVRG